MLTRHRVITLSAALLVLLSLAVVPVGAAPAPAAEPCYYIETHTGFILDVEGGSTADGARIIEWDREGKLNQKFYRVHFHDFMPDDVIFLQPASTTDKVLAVQRTDAGASVVQATFRGFASADPNQEWLEIPTFKGYKFRNVGTGLYLDEPGDSKGAGTPIIQWYGNRGLNQEFEYVSTTC